MLSVLRICLLLLWPMLAAAGGSVRLPPGENAADWRAAFELAGLQLALSPESAEVQIEEIADWWHVRAVQDGKVQRTVTVPAPHTPSEREEIAFLARALGRALTPTEDPGTALTRPPPPRPVAPAPQAPRPAPVVEPAPFVAAAVPEPPPPPVPEPLPPPPEPPAPVVDDDGFVAPGASEATFTAAPVDLDGGSKVSRGRQYVATPPMAVSVGMGIRPSTTVSLATRLQLDVVPGPVVSLGFGFGVAPMRPINPLGDRSLSRGFWDLDGAVSTAFQVSPPVRLEAVGGVFFRGFRQQGRAIDEGFVPYVGGAAEWTAGGRIRVGGRLRLITDLMSITMVDETGTSHALLPVEASLGVIVRIRALGDPNPAMPTLQQR